MSIAILPHPKQPLLRRAILAAIMIPLMFAALFCASHAFTIYSHNRAVDQYRFPTVTPPAQGESLLIISPHPDDETLGTAGLVQDALRAHVPVHIVFLTDGDAFRVGVASYYHEIHVRPADYVRYGLMREGEARAALGALGLPAEDVTFLGFPDQGMLPIWRQHWSSDNPYTSMYSRVSQVPYPDAYHPGEPFCGQAVVDDLKTLIARYKPTDVYVTHPSDDHPDHSSAPAYLNVALGALMAEGNSWTEGVRVHYYLVHRGDWPVPQGLDEKEPLVPPAQMLSLDTHWHSLNLSRPQTSLKKSALTHYGSQVEMMNRFLTSFVRSNELFGQIPEYNSDIIRVARDQITVDGNAREWPSEVPLDIDPAGDSVIRDFQSGADLRYVYVCEDDRNLYVRVDTQQPLSPDIHYNLYIRAFDAKSRTGNNGFTISFSPRYLSTGQATTVGRGIRAAWDGNTLEESIPLADLGQHPTDVYIEAASLFSRVIVDRTGIRCGHLAQPTAHATPLS